MTTFEQDFAKNIQDINIQLMQTQVTCVCVQTSLATTHQLAQTERGLSGSGP